MRIPFSAVRVTTGALMVAALALGASPAANAAEAIAPDSYRIQTVDVTPTTLTFQLTLGGAESVRQGGDDVIVRDNTTGTDMALPRDITTDDGRTAHGSWALGPDGTVSFRLDDSPADSAAAPGGILRSDDYWDCVNKSGWGGASGGAVSGCVLTTEVGCVEGGAAGGLAGGVAGLVGGLITCS